jgi:hypothetical protein
LISIMLTSKKLVAIHELTEEELREEQLQKESGEINLFGVQSSKNYNQILDDSHNVTLQQ